MKDTMKANRELTRDALALLQHRSGVPVDEEVHAAKIIRAAQRVARLYALPNDTWSECGKTTDAIERLTRLLGIDPDGGR